MPQVNRNKLQIDIPVMGCLSFKLYHLRPLNLLMGFTTDQ